MNRYQLIALWVGVALATRMFLYPPWHLALADGRSRDYGYAGLFVGPHADAVSALDALRQGTRGRPPERIVIAKINYPRLTAQWFLVAIVTGAAIVTLRHADNLRLRKGWLVTVHDRLFPGVAISLPDDNEEE